MHRWIGSCVLALGLSACGGGSPPVELSIAFGASFSTVNPAIVLSGRTFIPAGSICPPSNEYVIIGTLGPSTVTVHNAATGASTPGAVHSLWVCNAGSDTVDWFSNPVTLNSGPNLLTVSMSDSQRSSSATITVTRTGP